MTQYSMRANIVIFPNAGQCAGTLAFALQHLYACMVFLNLWVCGLWPSSRINIVYIEYMYKGPYRETFRCGPMRLHSALALQRTCACVYTYMHKCIHVYKYIFVYVYICIYMYTYICVCIYIYMYTHTHAHVRTHMHTCARARAHVLSLSQVCCGW